MNAQPTDEATTTVERTSDTEHVVTRTVNGPAHLVFRAWTEPELFRRWWVPRSFPVTLLSCEMDVRAGGGYRLEFGHEGSSVAFFGRYVEVTPPSRLVWTNEEDDAGIQVTTVTFEELEGRTRVTIHDRYPSKEALEAGIGSTDAMPEVLGQLDELLRDLMQDTGRIGA